jgi:hypothetical protein
MQLLLNAISLVSLGALAGCSGEAASLGSGTTGDEVAPKGEAGVKADAARRSAVEAGEDVGVVPSQDGNVADASSPACPAITPAVGAGCVAERQTCEYGSSFDIWCDTVLVCGSGMWGTLVRGSYETCAPTLAADCPATFADIDQTASCTVSGECSYPDGACECVLPGTEDYSPDSGAPPGVSASWACVDPACPMPRPRIGDACTTRGQSCDYVPCSYNELCMNGVWTFEFVAC